MSNNERARVKDLIERLKELPEDAPIDLIYHENDGHFIDTEEAKKSDIAYIGLNEYGVLEIGIE